MALAMAAMMAPSAAPFFIAYGRDTRRPQAVVVAVLVYIGLWAAIGVAIDAAMNYVMVPSSPVIFAIAVAFAVLYSLSPWSRRAQMRCRDMCSRAPRGTSSGAAFRAGLSYSWCCVICSAGLMVPLIVVGMTSLIVMALGAALMVVYKVGEWRTLGATNL